jgi:hypothetical protein
MRELERQYPQAGYNKRVQFDATAAAGYRRENWVMHGGFELKRTSEKSRRG